MKILNRQSTGVKVVEELNRYVKSKTILITCASVKGLDAETAISLSYASPPHILLHSRIASKFEPVDVDIKKLNPSIKTTYIQADSSAFSTECQDEERQDVRVWTLRRGCGRSVKNW